MGIAVGGGGDEFEEVDEMEEDDRIPAATAAEIPSLIDLSWRTDVRSCCPLAVIPALFQASIHIIMNTQLVHTIVFNIP